MGPKLAARLTALTVLVVGLLAAPAAAQDSLEEECLVALQAQLQPFTSDQLQALDAFFDEPGNVSLEAFLRDLLDDPTLSPRWSRPRAVHDLHPQRVRRRWHGR
jgi:hypothetical protein